MCVTRGLTRSPFSDRSDWRGALRAGCRPREAGRLDAGSRRFPIHPRGLSRPALRPCCNERSPAQHVAMEPLHRRLAMKRDLITSTDPLDRLCAADPVAGQTSDVDGIDAALADIARAIVNGRPVVPRRVKRAQRRSPFGPTKRAGDRRRDRRRVYRRSRGRGGRLQRTRASSQARPTSR